MGFLSGIGRAVHSPDFGMRLQAALAAAGGDQNAIYRMQEMQRQRAELALRERAAQQAEEDRSNQIWGLKEAGYSNPEIAAMNTGDASQAVRERFAPYQLAPGSARHIPGVGGAQEQVVTQPTQMAQEISALGAIDPRLGAGRAAREAFGGPQVVPPGGGLAVPGAGGYSWGVTPEGVSPQPGSPVAPHDVGNSTAGNNPGGLRYPGSTRFRTFPSQAAGIAAQESQIGRYMGRGINTVRSIVETYAPRRSRGGDNTDQQVDNYIAHVRQRLGIDPDQPLPASAVPQVAAAMREFETGHRGPSPRLGAGASPSPGQTAALRAEAQRAIAAGADPAAVNARLHAMGVN